MGVIRHSEPISVPLAVLPYEQRNVRNLVEA